MVRKCINKSLWLSFLQKSQLIMIYLCIFSSRDAMNKLQWMVGMEKSSPSVVQIGTKPSIEAVLPCTINYPIRMVLFGLAVSVSKYNVFVGICGVKVNCITVSIVIPICIFLSYLPSSSLDLFEVACSSLLLVQWMGIGDFFILRVIMPILVSLTPTL